MRFAAALLLLLGCAAAGAADEPPAEIWPLVRSSLFGERPIVEDDSGRRLQLTLPGRAADAAVVPLRLRYVPAPGEARARRVYLVIENNPSPVGAIFEFGPAAGATEVETRVRIEDYTWVRAIAETTDGALVMASHYIKAAGGCSAPAGKTLAERLVGMGEMRWRIDDAGVDAARPVQLMVRHPNNSGLAMDQLTRLYDPPHFVRSVRVTRDGELVFAAEVDFTISENPAFRFSLAPGSQGRLHAEVVDSNDLRFESTTAVGLP
ncbi:MAG: quinoprotein dehydrogenase-associated SoxYZ-like carrier [Burkholderiales bacterium]